MRTPRRKEGLDRIGSPWRTPLVGSLVPGPWWQQWLTKGQVLLHWSPSQDLEGSHIHCGGHRGRPTHIISHFHSFQASPLQGTNQILKLIHLKQFNTALVKNLIENKGYKIEYYFTKNLKRSDGHSSFEMGS